MIKVTYIQRIFKHQNERFRSKFYRYNNYAKKIKIFANLKLPIAFSTALQRKMKKICDRKFFSFWY